MTFDIDYAVCVIVMAVLTGIYVIAGLVIVPVVSLFTKKPDANYLENVFSCYDIPVTVTAKHSLNRH